MFRLAFREQVNLFDIMEALAYSHIHMYQDEDHEYPRDNIMGYTNVDRIAEDAVCDWSENTIRIQQNKSGEYLEENQDIGHTIGKHL